VRARADDDLTPTDPVAVVLVAVGDRGLAAERGADQDHLEPRRV
jgi:hypothetical protein